MKIMIYGDSNTWGDNFDKGKRIPTSKQWPIILSKKLGRRYQILQEGLPGRIAGNEDIEKKYKNGKDTFISTFRTCAPVDIVIIALGTNDLQLKYNKTKTQIIEDLKWYQEQIELEFEDDSLKYFNRKMPKIYYLMPINFDYMEYFFDESSEKKRQEIIKYFKDSKKYNVIIPNNTTLSDGIHLDYDGHSYIASIVYERIIKDEQAR